MEHQFPRNGTYFQDDKMSSLALREQLLLGSILAAALAGVGIKHWRDARREVPARRRRAGARSRLASRGHRPPGHAMNDPFLRHGRRHHRAGPALRARRLSFIRDALEYTTKQQKKKSGGPPPECHVSGQQLLEGVRLYALSQYGPMVPTVFEHWRVRSCEDIGSIVFNLIEAREFGKSEQDTIEDFRRGYDFDEAFVQPFRPGEQSAVPGRARIGLGTFAQPGLPDGDTRAAVCFRGKLAASFQAFAP